MLTVVRFANVIDLPTLTVRKLSVISVYRIGALKQLSTMFEEKQKRSQTAI